MKNCDSPRHEPTAANSRKGKTYQCPDCGQGWEYRYPVTSRIKLRLKRRSWYPVTPDQYEMLLGSPQVKANRLHTGFVEVLDLAREVVTNSSELLVATSYLGDAYHRACEGIDGKFTALPLDPTFTTRTLERGPKRKKAVKHD